MRKKLVLICILGLMSVLLAAGCGKKDTGAEATEVVTTVAESLAETEEVIEETVNDTTSPLAAAGFSDIEAETEDDEQAGPGADVEETEEKVSANDSRDAFEAFAERIQEIVADKDLEALGEILVYPCTIDATDGEPLEITDPDTLMKQNPDQIFGDNLMLMIATVDTAVLEETGSKVIMGEEGIEIVFKELSKGNYGIIEIHQ